MKEDKEEQNIIDLRIQFTEETGKYAIKYKYEYNSWLEKKLVKKLTLGGVVVSESYLNCVLCKQLEDSKKILNLPLECGKCGKTHTT